ncbi:MAG: hypothetical protein IPH44_33875 [Myxococcales bacterium]|nr:hypothetical protein [Myxococcales bacterium]
MTLVATEIHEAAVTAGEGCDPPDGTLCSPTCVFLGGRASSARASVSPREGSAPPGCRLHRRSVRRRLPGLTGASEADVSEEKMSYFKYQAMSKVIAHL